MAPFIWVRHPILVNGAGIVCVVPVNILLFGEPILQRMSPFLDRDLRVLPIDAYIDPSVPRARAIITHGHADHARSGHGAVLATPDTIAIMKVRYGEDCAGQFQPLEFNTPLQVDDVTITFFPAGHILGSDRKSVV